MFGELSLFDPGPRTATATAVTAGVLSSIGHDDLQPAAAGASRGGRAAAGRAGPSVAATNEAMADLVFSDSARPGGQGAAGPGQPLRVESEDGLRVTHDLTQEELAQPSGASRETVNKALADFAGRGFLRLEGRAVVILDVERLTRRAG